MVKRWGGALLTGSLGADWDGPLARLLHSFKTKGGGAKSAEAGPPPSEALYAAAGALGGALGDEAWAWGAWGPVRFPYGPASEIDAAPRHAAVPAAPRPPGRCCRARARRRGRARRRRARAA